MPKIIKNGKEYCSASSLGQASEILYDNSGSDLISETVQSAIGELNSNLETQNNAISALQTASAGHMSNKMILHSNANFNDITTVGFHTINSPSAYSPDGLNDGWWSMIVFRYDNNPSYLTQIACKITTRVLYVRTLGNGTWSDWNKLIGTANFSYSNGTLNITM